MLNHPREFYAWFAAIGLMAASLLPAYADPILHTDPRLQTLYKQEAARWEMWVGPGQKKKAEIVAEPIFRWQNLARVNGQSGAMYVWLFDRRPVVIGGVFTNPEGDKRMIVHELHALGPDRLYPVLREAENAWQPTAGITMEPLPDSPKVEETFARRTLQLRTIAHEFTANSNDIEQRRWELRLLPKPLYRYDMPQGPVIDGALMAFVRDAGTDPEIVLMLEARRDESGAAAWYFRGIRLSISDLHLIHRNKQVWTSMRDDPREPLGNYDKTYLLHRDRVLETLPAIEETPSK